jgi:uncharacterized SAM-binding protein YcdF (DUF218 family)
MRAGRKWLAAAVLLGAALLLHPVWLSALGEFLVRDEPLRKADGAVVLAGGWTGNRILKAGQVIRDGFAPLALVDGPPHHYGIYESELAIRFAVERGFPAAYFEALPMNANSTDEEARIVVEAVKKKGWKRVLLITSDYHTRRAVRVFSKHARGVEFHPVAAPDPHFSPRGWWKTREGRKTAFFEWVKTVTEPFGV